MKRPISASELNKVAWGTLKEITDNIDFINLQMSAAKRQERADKINGHLLGVFESSSYQPSKGQPKPPITDAIIDQAISYAQISLGEKPGQPNSLILDPRR